MAVAPADEDWVVKHSTHDDLSPMLVRSLWVTDPGLGFWGGGAGYPGVRLCDGGPSVFPALLGVKGGSGQLTPSD